MSRRVSRNRPRPPRSVPASLLSAVCVLLAGTLLATVLTAGDRAAADIPASDFDQVRLASDGDDLGEAMGLAVLPDRSVLTTSRDGRVLYTAEAGDTRVAARLDVYTHNEEGTQGIAIDPNFAENHWVYIYYAPALDTPAGDAPAYGTEADFAKWKGHNQLSRFRFDPESGTLDLASEQRILRVPTDRGTCCHAGGDIDFGPEGNLYLSTGDNSNPFESNGYAPLDDRERRNPVYDARRSAGNTNDLRGKLLRITVQEDGSYTIPEGNLFPKGTEATRPEIYAMGLRNPFRFDIDPETGTVWLGEYGPDAAAASERGPQGMVSYHRITGPGNFGWPFCVGDKTPEHSYARYDFATGEVGAKYDCQAGAVNDSRHNTGQERLPPAEPAWLTYDDDSVPEFGSGSESPMGGAVYHHDPDVDAPTKFPETYEGRLFVAEFGRKWIKSITLDDSGDPATIEDFPWRGQQIIDHEFGPDGSLYVLDYGEGFFSGDSQTALYRIDYSPDDKTPVATIDANVTAGHAPLTVELSGEASEAPDGDTLTYEWDLDGDGQADATGPTATHTFEEEGVYRAILRVTDETGSTGAEGVNIVVGNTPPQLEFTTPTEGMFMEFGDTVDFDVSVTDEEDAEVDCANVTVSFGLGHDNHVHRTNSTQGCQGSIETGLAEGHDTHQDVYGVLIVEYTDSGAGDLPPVTGRQRIILPAKHKQAEFHADSQGLEVVPAEGAEGGTALGQVGPGDWVSYDPMNFANTEEFRLRVAGTGGGTAELRAGSPDGAVIAEGIEIPAGDGTRFAATEPVPITDPGGTNEVFLVFNGDGGTDDIALVDALTVTGAGAGAPGAETTQPGRPDHAGRPDDPGNGRGPGS